MHKNGDNHVEDRNDMSSSHVESRHENKRTLFGGREAI